MNNTTTYEASTTSSPSTICIDTKDGINIATATLSLLLIVSEILPYCKPRESCNGIIHSLQCLLAGLRPPHDVRSNSGQTHGR